MPRTPRATPRRRATVAPPAAPAASATFSTLIRTSELAPRIGDERLIIVDVRHDLAHAEDFGERAYAQSHIPGAVFAHVDRDLSAPRTPHTGRHPLPTPEATAALFGRLGIDATKQVVVYDQDNGMFASRLWWMLRWLGHDAAAVLDGGFAQWTRDGLPVSSEPATARPTAFVPTCVRPTVNAAGIAASLPRHGLLLLDARAAERYRGDIEPLDPVAGHIPGALNRPYARNVASDGTFRSARELRTEFEGMLHGRPSDDIVHYCGSGISACHNLLAMTIAGYPLTRIYPGSWSDWVTDARRPVSRGQV
jgi:thiosulfate/3-mercaptopyruvate sulfurtransferase